jgi:hypothetical protein
MWTPSTILELAKKSGSKVHHIQNEKAKMSKTLLPKFSPLYVYVYSASFRYTLHLSLHNAAQL